MNLKISYIDNKDYFYRIVNDLNMISNGELIDDLYFYDDNNSEINLINKLNIMIDYFNISFDNKKYMTCLNKMIIDVIDEDDNNKLSNYYNKIKHTFECVLSKIDLSLSIND